MLDARTGTPRAAAETGVSAVIRFVLWVAACFLIAGGVFRLGRGEYGLALADWLGAAIGLVGFGLWRLPQGASKAQAEPQATAAQTEPQSPLLTDEQVLDRVLAYARKEQVPILPRSWQMWSRKPHRFGADIGACYDHRTGIVWILPEYHRNPWILLHELGHRVLMVAGKWSHSEAEADHAGRDLALAMLTPEEAQALRWKIDIWLSAADQGKAAGLAPADGAA